MTPPELLPPTDVLAPPVTVRPPLTPVLLSTMPLTGSAPALLLPEEMSWKVRPLAPIVVLATFRAVPLVALRVLFDPVPLPVPPPVARKPVPELVSTVRLPPLKLTVAPVLV